MNILLTSYYPLPSLGGIWTFVSQLKNQLETFGHHVDILSLNQDNGNYRIIGTEEIDKKTIEKRVRSLKRRQLRSRTQASAWIHNVELNRYRLQITACHQNLSSYDIIHAQDVISASTISKIKRSQVPIVTSAHGYLSGAIFYNLKTRHPSHSDSEIKQFPEYKYHNALETEGYHASDLIHVQSQWMFHKIGNEFSVPANKLRTFPYALDHRRFFTKSDRSSTIPRPQNKKVILFSGRLVYLKGIHHLIDALGLLKQKRSDWVCWLLGEGELEGALRAQCKQLGIEHDVQFLGVRNNVIDYLQQSDLFVLPSLQDTQPHSVMEAQVSGVPVIVSNASGLPEMVENGKTGLITSAGDHEQLYKQINYLLDNDSIRQQLGIHAKKWAEQHWSLTKLANNTIALYEEAKRQR